MAASAGVKMANQGVSCHVAKAETQDRPRQAAVRKREELLGGRDGDPEGASAFEARPQARIGMRIAWTDEALGDLEEKLAYYAANPASQSADQQIPGWNGNLVRLNAAR